MNHENIHESSDYPTEQETELKSPSGPHKFQKDYDIALFAFKLGKHLGLIWSIVHALAFTILLVFGSALGPAGGMIIFFGGIAIVLSWAVVYSLLSIVVTNAISAKHMVYQSAKMKP